MAFSGERFLAFLLTLHVLLYFGGVNGLITNQQGENPHLQVIDTFDGNDLTSQAQVSDSSGIIEQTFSPGLAISGLINTLVGILWSPYISIGATALPGVLQVLFTTLLGLFETITAYRIATGRL